MSSLRMALKRNIIGIFHRRMFEPLKTLYTNQRHSRCTGISETMQEVWQSPRAAGATPVWKEVHIYQTDEPEFKGDEGILRGTTGWKSFSSCISVLSNEMR